MTAPTSPKPHAPTDPTESKDASTTLDNGPVDAGLRTDLTKLADEMDPDDVVLANGFIDKIRALLAANPAPETDEVCGNCLGHGVETCAAHTAPVSDTRREDVSVEAIARVLHSRDVTEDDLPEGSWQNAAVRYRYRSMAEAVLAVLPTPPVVDEAEIAARALDEAAEAWWEPHDREHDSASRWLEERAARLRGATRA